MTAIEQLKAAQRRQMLYKSHKLAISGQTEEDSLQSAYQKAHEQAMHLLDQRQIEWLTRLAAQEMVAEELQKEIGNIDFSINLNGDKLSSAIADGITTELTKTVGNCRKMSKGGRG